MPATPTAHFRRSGSGPWRGRVWMASLAIGNGSTARKDDESARGRKRIESGRSIKTCWLPEKTMNQLEAENRMNQVSQLGRLPHLTNLIGILAGIEQAFCAVTPSRAFQLV